MELTRKKLHDYIDLIHPGTPAQKKQLLHVKLLERVDSGIRDLFDTRIMEDESGKIVASIRLVNLAQDFWILSELTIRDGVPKQLTDRATDLIGEIMKRAVHLKARQVFSRINSLNYFDRYGHVLAENGFRRIGERVEFQTPVNELPDETGSPFDWISMDQSGMETAIDLFGRVSQGAPDWDPDDDPGELLKLYFSEEGLSCGPQCLHIGYLNGTPAAVVIAQVARSDGWSRITHMGLIPDLRGKAYGQWLHRHGFSMIRSQKGSLYHGGCLAANKPMIALFRKHGCREHLRAEEWVWKSAG
ncbi:hypothetical protein JXA40_10615 [bacterium]|nr:hypothetical protein [candidate division CSSED10-310 bacterium]